MKRMQNVLYVCSGVLVGFPLVVPARSNEGAMAFALGVALLVSLTAKAGFGNASGAFLLALISNLSFWTPLAFRFMRGSPMTTPTLAGVYAMWAVFLFLFCLYTGSVFLKEVRNSRGRQKYYFILGLLLFIGQVAALLFATGMVGGT